MHLTTLIVDYFLACWNVLREAAPFMLFGFFVAGLLKALLPPDWMSRHLGGRGPLSVIKAALIGVPLPLCSCGVLPAAMGLRRQGAGAGATTAFMISTPETGVDSLAVTYAMIDPLMTVLRPLAAFCTATIAGLAANLLPERLLPAMATQASASPTSCCSGGSCKTACAPKQLSVGQRLRQGIGEAFGDMLADVGGWLLLGILAAGCITLFLPPELVAAAPGGEWTAMLAMLALGVPMYVCASSSTPIAASLLLKGLSPGAALVFLLAGPATNATTLTAMSKTFGVALTAVYLGAIVVCSLAFGYMANHLYAALGFNIHAVLGAAEEGLPGLLETASAVLLLILVARALWLNRHGH